MQCIQHKFNKKDSEMNKTSAMKIKDLETRIAHLEREAGIFKSILNVPKTIMEKASRMVKDISSYFKISPKTAREKREVAAIALRDSLQARIGLALDPNIIFNDPSVEIVIGEYNTSAPERTIVSIGEHEMPLRDLPSFLVKLGFPREAKDVKGAYVSWHNDFKDVIRILKDGDISKSDEVTFFQRVKRFSKLLYRVLKALWDFGYAYEFFKTLIQVSTIATVLFASPLAVSSTFVAVVFGPFIGERLLKGLTNIIEGSLRRSDSNMQEFDELAFGKQASSHPYMIRFAQQLEQYC